MVDEHLAATERIARLETLVLQLTSSVLSVANHVDELKRRVDAICDTDKGVCERAAFAVSTATNLLQRVQTVEAQLQRLATK